MFKILNKGKKPVRKDPVEEHMKKLDRQRPRKVNVNRVLRDWKTTPCLDCPRFLRRRNLTRPLEKPLYCDSDKCEI